MIKRNGTEIAKDITVMVNSISYSSREFVEEIIISHRTIQQSIFRLIIDLLKAWESMYIKGNYDLRNEHTVKFASIMLESLRNANYGIDTTPHI